MTVSFQLVGNPCGHRGPYAFYKSFRYRPGAPEGGTAAVPLAPCKTISVGDFFFMRIDECDEAVSIGELQLLWEDRTVPQRTLSSCRVYSLPENTPDGRLDLHGADEVLANKERIVLRVDDLVRWIATDVHFDHGLKGLYSDSLTDDVPALQQVPQISSDPAKSPPPPPTSSSSPPLPPPVPSSPSAAENSAVRPTSPTSGGDAASSETPSGAVPDDKCPGADGEGGATPAADVTAADVTLPSTSGPVRTFIADNVGDVSKNGDDAGGSDEWTSTHDADELTVRILSFPHYCRYRGMIKRLEGLTTESWLQNALIVALGGVTVRSRNCRLLFCREIFEHPLLETNEFLLNHLAPKLKGRPRKKRLKTKRSNSPSSESNESECFKDSTSPTKENRPRNGLKKVLAGEDLEEQDFLQRLFKFMRKQNTPIDRVPNLGFKQINLYFFYTIAQKLGGYDKITTKRLWKRLYDQMGGNPGSTSAATCTRRHYERLLLPFETHEKGATNGRRSGKQTAAAKRRTVSSSSRRSQPDSPLNDDDDDGGEVAPESPNSGSGSTGSQEVDSGSAAVGIPVVPESLEPVEPPAVADRQDSVEDGPADPPPSQSPALAKEKVTDEKVVSEEVEAAEKVSAEVAAKPVASPALETVAAVVTDAEAVAVKSEPEVTDDLQTTADVVSNEVPDAVSSPPPDGSEPVDRKDVKCEPEVVADAPHEPNDLDDDQSDDHKSVSALSPTPPLPIAANAAQLLCQQPQRKRKDDRFAEKERLWDEIRRNNAFERERLRQLTAAARTVGSSSTSRSIKAKDLLPKPLGVVSPIAAGLAVRIHSPTGARSIDLSPCGGDGEDSLVPPSCQPSTEYPSSPPPLSKMLACISPVTELCIPDVPFGHRPFGSCPSPKRMKVEEQVPNDFDRRRSENKFFDRLAPAIRIPTPQAQCPPILLQNRFAKTSPGIPPVRETAAGSNHQHYHRPVTERRSRQPKGVARSGNHRHHQQQQQQQQLANGNFSPPLSDLARPSVIQHTHASVGDSSPDDSAPYSGERLHGGQSAPHRKGSVYATVMLHPRGPLPGQHHLHHQRPSSASGIPAPAAHAGASSSSSSRYRPYDFSVDPLRCSPSVMHPPSATGPSGRLSVSPGLQRSGRPWVMTAAPSIVGRQTYGPPLVVAVSPTRRQLVPACDAEDGVLDLSVKKQPAPVKVEDGNEARWQNGRREHGRFGEVVVEEVRELDLSMKSKRSGEASTVPPGGRVDNYAGAATSRGVRVAPTSRSAGGDHHNRRGGHSAVSPALSSGSNGASSRGAPFANGSPPGDPPTTVAGGGYYVSQHNPSHLLHHHHHHQPAKSSSPTTYADYGQQLSALLPPNYYGLPFPLAPGQAGATPPREHSSGGPHLSEHALHANLAAYKELFQKGTVPMTSPYAAFAFPPHHVYQHPSLYKESNSPFMYFPK